MSTNKLGMVVYSCSPSYLEGAGRRTTVPDQPHEKSLTLYQKNKAKMSLELESSGRAPA
jgi:hypothetical protein